MAKIKFVNFTPREKKPKLRKHKKRPNKHEKRQKGLQLDITNSWWNTFIIKCLDVNFNYRITITNEFNTE